MPISSLGNYQNIPKLGFRHDPFELFLVLMYSFRYFIIAADFTFSKGIVSIKTLNNDLQWLV